MLDTELYAQILGVRSPWTVSRVSLQLAVSGRSIVAPPLIGIWPFAIPFVVAEIYLLMLAVPLKDVVLEE